MLDAKVTLAGWVEVEPYFDSPLWRERFAAPSEVNCRRPC
jgi:hypothetical protein